MKPRSPFALAIGALVLALTSPAIVFASLLLGARAPILTAVLTPLIALSILFAFAFHVRFALGAIAAEKKPSSALAWIAIVTGVTGLIGSMLVLMGIVTL